MQNTYVVLLGPPIRKKSALFKADFFLIGGPGGTIISPSVPHYGGCDALRAFVARLRAVSEFELALYLFGGPLGTFISLGLCPKPCRSARPIVLSVFAVANNRTRPVV